MKIMDSLKKYKKDLQIAFKNNPKLNESGTRLLVNDFLRNVLGYSPNEEIKTEFEIGGGYADYVIQIGKKKKFVVEVKACGIKLNENHLRQSLGYAAEEGIDWILLLNGRQFQLYKVIFAKPVSTKLVFNIDLLNESDLKKSIERFDLLSKKSMSKNILDEYWKKVDSLSPETLSKYLFDDSVIKLLRKNLKNKIGIQFSIEDISNALYGIVTTQINMAKPKVKNQRNSISKSKIEKNVISQQTDL